MELIKGTKSFAERPVLIRDPQKAIAELLLSKQEQRKIKKYPEWDKPRVGPSTELIKARRDLERVDEELRLKWAEETERRKVMDQQWEEMRRQELLLRQSFIRFNRFVKENAEKRDRAEQKIKEEQKRQKQRQAEIDDLTKKLDYMRSVRDKMRKYVQEYKKYQNYLERVVSQTGEFQSINQIFSRYETLVEARKVLAEHQDKNLRALEDTGTEIHRLTEAKTQMLMGLQNKLAGLQARRDKAKALALKWEGIVSRIKATAAEKDLELIQVKTCCWNIYQQICKRKGVPAEVARDDVEHQLIHIKRTVLELKRIIKVAKKAAAKEEKEMANR